MIGDSGHPRQHTRTEARYRQSVRWWRLRGQNLFDSLRDVVSAASPRAGSTKLSFRTEMGFDGFSGQFRDRDTASLGFVPKLGVELIRKFDRSSIHDMPAYP